MSEQNQENEEIHYISDQDEGEDKPQIESIIKEKIKLFQNESDAIRILLSDHYRPFRIDFFKNLTKKTKDNCIFDEIKQQIRNILNTYRIYLDKEKDEIISKELKDLNDLLKAYYKDSYFDNVFFVNYFKDIKELNKSKKKYIFNYPKDEIETLNDIERKVKIIKDLKYYLNLTIADKIQINYDLKNIYYTNPYSELKFNYLVIDEDEFSKMNEEKLKEHLSNNISSNKLRRPLSSYIAYNYIPILCKGSCLKEAHEFNDNFEKWIIQHINEVGCERCIQTKLNLNKIKSQIKSLYIKTCIFSHNINEIMFHPLILFSMSSFDNFYKKALRKKPNKEIEKLVRSDIIPKLFNKSKYDLQIIYNPAKQGMKSIYNALLEYSKRIGLYIDCCYKNELKTQPCPLPFKLNNNDYVIHMEKCNCYHSKLEKRRMYKIIENEICNKAIEEGGWVINNEDKVYCDNGDYCNKFHTRNELFFDERNYRKLYPCTDTYFCEKEELCPKKHAIDINISEIFLPEKYKEELKLLLAHIKEKDKKIQEQLKLFKIVQCNSCLTFINGIQNRNMFYFEYCKHKICSKCFQNFQSCPLCGIKGNYENNEEKREYIEIILDYKLPKPKKKEFEKDELILIKNKEPYDDDINLPKEESIPPFDRKRNHYKDFNSNKNNYNQNNRNNKYHCNNRSYRGGGRGKNRGRGGVRGKGNYRENNTERNEEPKEEYGPKHNFNIENRKENEKNDESKEIRRGKGRVRGSTRGKMNNNRRDPEKVEYYIENKEEDNSNNIKNFEHKEDEKNEDESYAYEDEFSMRNEDRKGKGVVRGRGRRKEQRNNEEDESNKEEIEQSEQTEVKLTVNDENADEDSN